MSGSSKKRGRSSRRRPIIAIDGPVGAGKSTVARELARALGFTWLNTGALYRAVAVAARAAAIDPEAPDAAGRLGRLLDRIAIGFDSGHVRLDGRDITEELTDPAVTDLASRVSALEIVRDRLRGVQRAAGAAGGIVMEGRDIGTVVFPDAEFKFFLDASKEERARRRHAELRARGVRTTYAAVLSEIAARDRRDRERALAPLKRAPGAIVIDSSAIGVAEIVAGIKARVDASLSAHKGLKQIKPGCKDR